jgi:hypothetical protein
MINRHPARTCSFTEHQTLSGFNLSGCRTSHMIIKRGRNKRRIMNNAFSIRSGTISGTLTVILCNIPIEELIKIALSAAIGTTVSFLISVLLNRLVKKRDR